jgi:hypothetical protein
LNALTPSNFRVSVVEEPQVAVKKETTISSDASFLFREFGIDPGIR